MIQITEQQLGKVKENIPKGSEIITANLEKIPDAKKSRQYRINFTYRHPNGMEYKSSISQSMTCYGKGWTERTWTAR